MEFLYALALGLGILALVAASTSPCGRGPGRWSPRPSARPPRPGSSLIKVVEQQG